MVAVEILRSKQEPLPSRLRRDPKPQKNFIGIRRDFLVVTLQSNQWADLDQVRQRDDEHVIVLERVVGEEPA